MQTHHRPNARASLEVSLVFNQSTVTGAYASSPMKLLTPRSRGTSVCAYVSNFGGGLVAGDQTCLELRLGKEARCFVGTQSSTKVYRNPGSLPCAHETHAHLDAGALLVFAPAPVQPFADSCYVQRQEFHLAPGAGLVLLDWFTAGRRARGERWAFARFATRNEVWILSDPPARSAEVHSAVPQTSSLPNGNKSRDLMASMAAGQETVNGVRSNDSLSSRGEGESSEVEQCVFLDSLRLNPSEADLASPYCTGRFNCFAMLLLIGALVKKTALEILQETSALPVQRRAPLLVSASPVKDGAVLRIAGEEAADVEKQLRRCLEPLSRLLGDAPWSRRY